MKLQGIKLIIGLGNPGKEYERTYHSAGFLFVDYLIKNPSISNFHPPASGGGLISKPLKSDVYMNESGKFVKKALQKYQIKPEEILITHDDSDIEIGKYKISFGRGSAGHNGVESIIKALKTKNFWRLRVGIRKKTGLPADLSAKAQRATAEARQVKAGEIVLKKISKKDLEILEDVFKKSLENLF